jgi:hypothetical protein
MRTVGRSWPYGAAAQLLKIADKTLPVTFYDRVNNDEEVTKVEVTESGSTLLEGKVVRLT